MTTGYAPPTIPSVETGTPPREWSESVLASSPAGDTPSTFSEAPRREGDSKTTEVRPREKSELSKEKQSEPTTTRDEASIGATDEQTAKQSVAEQVGKAVDCATQTATSHLSDSQGIKDAVTSHLCKLLPCVE